jgi:hypothetical protein
LEKGMSPGVIEVSYDPGLVFACRILNNKNPRKGRE